MSKKKIILFTSAILLVILIIAGFFIVLQYKNEKVIVEQAKFEIKIPQGNENFAPTGITSKNIKKVGIIETDDSKNGIEIILDDEGRKIFEEVTTKIKGNQLGLFIDDVIISLPYVQETIQDGRLMITHDFTDTDLLNLKARLQGYYYPNSMEYKDFQIF